MIDLGSGLRGDLVHHTRVCCVDEHEHGGFTGLAVHHPGADGSDCITNAFWCDSRTDDAHNVVELGQIQPLTVSGTIACSMCGLSGTITDGKWVAA